MNELTKTSIEFPSRIDAIKAVFQPSIEALKQFEAPYAEILAIEDVTTETCAKAKRLRLDIAKIRCQAENTRKEQKEQYLRAGQEVDDAAKLIKAAAVEKEQKLEQIETYYLRAEAARITKLAAERSKELDAFECFNVPELGEMRDDVYANFLIGTKANFEAKKEAERKAEAERLEKIKAEAEEREKIKLENAKLKAEAEEKEKQMQAERDKQAAILAEERAKAKAEAARLKAEADAVLEKERKERAKANAEAARLKAEADAVLEKERKERTKIEAELKAKQDAEIKEKARIAREEKKAQTAPDRIKLIALAEKVDTINFPDCASEEARDTIRDVAALLNKVSVFLKTSIEKLG